MAAQDAFDHAGQAGFAGGTTGKARLADRKSRLADKGCAGLDGAERQESTRSRAARGV